MNNEAQSSIRGVSIRGWLALITVVSGLAFLYLTALLSVVLLPLDPAVQIALLIITPIVGFINLSLGYYLGQKTQIAPET